MGGELCGPHREPAAQHPPWAPAPPYVTGSPEGGRKDRPGIHVPPHCALHPTAHMLGKGGRWASPPPHAPVPLVRTTLQVKKKGSHQGKGRKQEERSEGRQHSQSKIHGKRKALDP